MNFYYLLHLISTEKKKGHVLTGRACKLIYQQNTKAENKDNLLLVVVFDCFPYGLVV